MASKKDPQLSADDLGPLVDKLSEEELFRLAYRALRIARELAGPRATAEESPSPEGLPDMTEFHRSFGTPPYSGNTVIEMREEDDR